MYHKPHIDRDHLLELLRQMLRVRRFEEKCAQLYTQEKIRGFLHLYIGEEAIAVGILPQLQLQDAVVSTYREHGHAIARGVDMGEIMAEMYGKASGSSGGRGGSMHIFDRATRFFGGNAIVAGGLPIAVGLALADQFQGKNNVTVCFFGEGAVAEGEFHESLNLAALWKLPVLLVCENNGYAMGTALKYTESEQDIHKKAANYGMVSKSVDGMNVVDVEAEAKQCIDAIRAGEGPQFLECHTYRFRGHSMFDSQLYREKDEIKEWQDKGPIVRLVDWLKKYHHFNEEELAAIDAKVQLEVEQAVEFAENAKEEPVSDLLRHVLTEPSRQATVFGGES